MPDTLTQPNQPDVDAVMNSLPPADDSWWKSTPVAPSAPTAPVASATPGDDSWWKGTPVAKPDEGKDSAGAALFLKPKDVQQFLGVPYKFGGQDCKEGVDCSAFTQAIYARNGVNGLPRTADAQWTDTKVPAQRVSDVAQLQPGMQLFFQGKRLGPGKASHTAYFAGWDTQSDGTRVPMMYAASSAAGAVVKQRLDTFLQHSGQTFLGAKQYADFQHSPQTGQAAHVTSIPATTPAPSAPTPATPPTASPLGSQLGAVAGPAAREASDIYHADEAQKQQAAQLGAAAGSIAGPGAREASDIYHADEAAKTAQKYALPPVTDATTNYTKTQLSRPSIPLEHAVALASLPRDQWDAYIQFAGGTKSQIKPGQDRAAMGATANQLALSDIGRDAIYQKAAQLQQEMAKSRSALPVSVANQIGNKAATVLFDRAQNRVGNFQEDYAARAAGPLSLATHGMNQFDRALMGQGQTTPPGSAVAGAIPNVTAALEGMGPLGKAANYIAGMATPSNVLIGKALGPVEELIGSRVAAPIAEKLTQASAAARQGGQMAVRSATPASRALGAAAQGVEAAGHSVVPAAFAAPMALESVKAAKEGRWDDAAALALAAGAPFAVRPVLGAVGAAAESVTPKDVRPYQEWAASVMKNPTQTYTTKSDLLDSARRMVTAGNANPATLANALDVSPAVAKSVLRHVAATKDQWQVIPQGPVEPMASRAGQTQPAASQTPVDVGQPNRPSFTKASDFTPNTITTTEGLTALHNLSPTEAAKLPESLFQQWTSPRSKESVRSPEDLRAIDEVHEAAVNRGDDFLAQRVLGRMSYSGVEPDNPELSPSRKAAVESLISDVDATRQRAQSRTLSTPTAESPTQRPATQPALDPDTQAQIDRLKAGIAAQAPDITPQQFDDAFTTIVRFRQSQAAQSNGRYTAADLLKRVSVGEIGKAVTDAANAPEVPHGPATWTNAGVDHPVNVTGYAGEHGGRHYVNIEGSNTAVPLDEVTSATPTNGAASARPSTPETAISVPVHQPNPGEAVPSPVSPAAPDNAIVNLPVGSRARGGSIDAQIDRFKSEQASAAKETARTETAARKAAKDAAKPLAVHDDAIADSFVAKRGGDKKDVLSTLDQMRKWEPQKYVDLVYKWLSENTPQPTPAPGETASMQQGTGPGAFRTEEHYPVSKIQINKDVPQFKEGADIESGVVPTDKLSGDYERLGTGPIVVWEKNDGTTEVITGRHRLDLARRNGEKTIPVQVVKESNGFTAHMAAMFDAEANIRDGKGTVRDYVRYFNATKDQLTEGQARQRSLLQFSKGRTGWDIGRNASDDVRALYLGNRITEQQAGAISRAAPGDASLQQIGVRYALAGHDPDYISNIMQAVESAPKEKGNLNLFGEDDSALRTAEAQAKRAGEIQKDIRNRIQSASGAAKRPELAKELGIDVNDPAAVATEVARLKTELKRWDRWAAHPDLVQRTLGAPEPTRNTGTLEPTGTDSALFQRGERPPESDRVAAPPRQRYRILSPDRESEVTITDSPNLVDAFRKEGYHPVPVQDDFAPSKSSQPQGPGRLFQRDEEKAPPFYSKAERVVTEKMGGRMPSDALRKMLLNNGVKPDEMKWSGLDELLDRGGAVTKDEVLKHLQENNVQVREVVKGGQPRTAPEGWHSEGTTDTKYGNYQLPGGSNYRELLLTLPQRLRPSEESAQDFYENFVRRGGEPAWDQLSTSQQQDIIRNMPNEARNAEPQYRSSHWDEPNVLAHVRMNDRTGPNGEKILHVEEVQSDWHQEGRKKGYNNEEKFQDLLRQRSALPEGSRARFAIQEQLDAMAAGPHGKGVPDAPFSKTWHELAAKRILRYAAENGYDKVSWTPGEAQAERYDLSKQVDAVRLTPDNRLQVVQKGSGNFQELDTPPITEANLADYIGKDAAEKLLNAPETHKGREISGVDLKVGGEGMKGFYDKILPDTFNKLGKPFGARVGETKIATEVAPVRGENAYTLEPLHDTAVPSIDITPELRKAATGEGFPLFQDHTQDSLHGVGGPKAAIQFEDGFRSTMQFFGHADVTSIQHEFMHDAVDVQRELAEGGHPQAVKDYDTLSEFAGATKDGGKWSWTEAAHEKVARAWERYLHDGVAPTEELKGVFERMRDWFKAVYQRVRGSSIDVDLTPEVREYFDRMLGKGEEAGGPVSETPSPERVPAREPGAEAAQPDVSRNPAPTTTEEEPHHSQFQPRTETGEFNGPPGVSVEKTTGVAQRVHDARAEAGEARVVERGKGVGAKEQVQRGRDLIKQGRDPQKLADEIRGARVQAVTGDEMAVLRARHEELSRAADRANDAYVADKTPENKAKRDAAMEAERDWAQNVIKPMQTEWHKVGQAQQGEVGLDTGSFTSVSRAYEAAKGSKLTPGEERRAQDLTAHVTRLDAQVQDLKSKLDAAMEKEAQRQAARPTRTRTRPGDEAKENKPKPLPSDPDELAKHFAKRIENGSLFGGKVAGGRNREAGAVRVSNAPQFTQQEIQAIWNHAKSRYIDVYDIRTRKNADFTEMVEGTARDLGLKPEWVKQALASNKTARDITDAMYKSMADRRDAVRRAQAWVEAANVPVYRKVAAVLGTMPRAIAVFGHGTVGLTTHAGLNIMRPTTWKAYWPAFFQQFKVAYGPHGRQLHEQLMQRIEQKPDYVMKLRAGLNIDPAKRYDNIQQYSQELGKVGGFIGRMGDRGDRGMDLLKVFRDELFDREWNRLSAPLKTPEMARQLSDWINHASGSGNIDTGYGAISRVVKAGMFAPSKTAAEWARVVGDPAKTAATFGRVAKAKAGLGAMPAPEEVAIAKLRVKRAAELAAVYGGLLAANYGLQAATGQDDKVNLTDPTKSDFLKFKWNGKTYDPTGGATGPVHFMGQVFADILKGDRYTAASDTYKYAQGKFAPQVGTAFDLGFRKDAGGRPLPGASDEMKETAEGRGKEPYSWGEYLWQRGPIPLAGASREYYETLRDNGVDHSTAAAMVRAAQTFAIEQSGVRIGKTPEEKEPKGRTPSFLPDPGKEIKRALRGSLPRPSSLFK